MPLSASSARYSPKEFAGLGQVLAEVTGSTQRRSGGDVKAVVYERYGLPDVLRVENVPMPSPAAGQVLVKGRGDVGQSQ
jgi:hypothetical protein